MARMEIAACNTAPNFSTRRSLTASELQRLEDPCVVMEYEGVDNDGAFFWAYTVGGILDGHPIGDARGGCTIGGDVIIISGVDRREIADGMANLGLLDTLQALDAELSEYLKSMKALERLNSAGALEVINQSIKPDSDKSDQFVADVEAIRPLRGDGIILAAGTVEQGPTTH